MLDERDIDRLLDGRPVEGAEDLAEVLAGMRAAYARDPGPELRERLLAAMASEAPAPERPSITPRQRRRMLPTRIALRLGAATGALLLGTASLAVAGVNLPDPAADAFDRAGLTLPNQNGDEPGDRGRSEEVRSVIESTPPEERGGQGCAFGHRVAEAAKGSPLPAQARENCARGDEEQGTRQGPPEGTPQGPPEGTPQGPPAGTPQGPPEGTPQGPPEGTPQGPPAGTPQGRPEGTPQGPPAGTPQGRPEGTPQGPPEGTPQGRPDDTPSGPPEGVPGGRP